MYQDIKDRTFNFGLRIINLSVKLPNNTAGYVLGKQILRSGASVGVPTYVGIEEAVAAFSKDDYIYKMSVALKEARETHYWLRLIDGSKMIERKRLEDLIIEAEEIKKILGAIVSKLRGKSKNQIKK
ncbi:MAG: four helix bundle protein [Bacteroidota bacterium]|nr:four helix bundle protein [Bacteroidota bacterium]